MSFLDFALNVSTHFKPLVIVNPRNVSNFTFQMLSEFEDEQKKFVKMQQRRQGECLIWNWSPLII